MLPPSFENKSAHQYGTFTLLVHKINTEGIQMETVDPHFFGNVKYQHQMPILLPVKVQYQIATNLWHFYAYLTDCKIIPLILTDQQGQTYAADIQLQLMPSSQVLNKFNTSIDYLFQEQSYLTRCKQKVQIFDRSHRIVGNMDAEIKLSFDEEINRVLYAANMIDFDNILVLEELSPLPSSVDLQTSILPEDIPAAVPEKGKYTNIETERVEPLLPNSPKKDNKAEQNVWPSNMPSKIDHAPRIQDDDEKMMEDDIDRMIAEMQNRPYDSSRYLENSNQALPKENVNYSNWHGSNAEKRSSQKLPPRYPTAIKPSHSPGRAYQPILSYTMKTPVMQLCRTNYQMNSTGHLPVIHNRSHSRQVASTSASKYEPKVGVIGLKIHELMVQRPQSELSLILKLYINDSENQYYATNSLRQGQAILFNSNIKIDQKIDIHQLKFELIESYDMRTIYARGTFDMARLYGQNPAKGIFMVNLLTPAPTNQSASRTIRVDEQQVVKVIPNIKSLRIQLQYQEPLEIVQLYICLSEFSKICKSCRYKIPLTKETIEFRVADLSQNRHMNVFPHNRSSANRSGDRIIVELWGEKELIGFNEINLKPLYNTNQRMINSSLEPIYLYDEHREVVDFKGAKTKGYFDLNLCYGTISQVQNILNQNNGREVRKEQPKTPVQVESHLGIYIKENRSQKEVQIQFDSPEISPTNLTRHESRKNELNLTQQQELPDQDDEEQFMGESKISENQFLNKTMEQKYLKEETVPIFSKPEKPSAPEEKSTMKADSFIATKKQIPHKSMTKQFQDLIKSAFQDFSTEQIFQRLKDECEGHLLYNVIEKVTLVEVFHSLGISQTKINIILDQILLITNQMISVNVLYDMIYGLVLEGFVKEKYIDDYQLGRYCLSQFYKVSKGMGDGQLEDVLIDDNTQFDEARKMYAQIGYKLTMRQFKQIEIYLNKIKQNQPKLTYQSIKDKLLMRQVQKVEKEQQKQKYEQEVMNKLYGAEWDDQDDYFISNINQKNTHEEEEEEPSDSMNTLVKPASTHIFQVTNSQKQKSDLTQKCQQPSISLKMEPSPQKAIDSNFQMIVDGFESCIEAAECHLDINMVSAKLKITYRDCGHPHQIFLNHQQNRQTYKLNLTIENDEDYLDGCLELITSSQIIAKCNYSIIKGVRSVYALKSIQQAEFCGLIYLEYGI